MADLQFTCEACDQAISLGREFSGARVECPSCRRLTEVPGPRVGSVRRLNVAATLPDQILGVEIKFLCRECDCKLMIDFRWQGRTIDCPRCQKMIQVPRLGMSPGKEEGELSAGRALSQSRLSSEEFEFLSVISLPGS